ncbi:ryncolin-1-like [Styela clava]
MRAGKTNPFFLETLLILQYFVCTSKASISLGTCQLSCDENESQLPSRVRGPPGSPGKRGPVGNRGLVGPKGSPSSCCEDLVERNEQLERQVQELNGWIFPHDCAAVKSHVISSGTYVIHPFNESKQGVQVYCDQETDGGGWIVIQRRLDGSEDFYRDWEDYVTGFGYKEQEFWLGLETMHRISINGLHEIRFDFITRGNEKIFAKYGQFQIAGAEENYRITITGYSGNAGDSMANHNNNQFTTKDQENDHDPGKNCAVSYKGGWWYNRCHNANLNGLYADTTASAKGLSWFRWKNSYTPFAKFVEMKIRKRRN